MCKVQKLCHLVCFTLCMSYQLLGKHMHHMGIFLHAWLHFCPVLTTPVGVM